VRAEKRKKSSIGLPRASGDGKRADAEADFRRSIEALARQGCLAEARLLCRERMAADPDAVDAHHCLAMLLSAESDWSGALECATKVLSLAPGHFAAALNAGIALDRLGRSDEAVAALERAAALGPERADAHFALGNALAAGGEHGRACACFRLAAGLAPENPECLNNLGATLLNLGHPAEAEAVLRTALTLVPDHIGSAANLAEACRIQDRHDEAEVLCLGVLERAPDSAAALHRLGMVWADLGRIDDALGALRRSLELAPHRVEAHICLALTLLADGRYPDGWREYEWRCRLPAWKKAEPPLPAWTGQSLEGQSILLWGEQGTGDILQFLRFAPFVKALGAAVCIRIAADLVPLAQTIAGIDAVFATGAGAPEADFQASLHSLPHLLGVEFADIDGAAYLSVPAGRRETWRALLDGVTGLRVGLAWAGNAGNRQDVRRSAPPELLAALPRVPGITYVNLQVGPRSGEFACFGEYGLDLADRIADYGDTAAIIAEMDVVLTVDTVVAHLAGALGQPALVLLPYASDWRWLRGRDDSPWYDSIHLFRQAGPGDWRGPAAAAAEFLVEMVEAGNAG